MSFLIFLLVGLIAGILAKAIMPGSSNEPAGWVMTIVLGIVGAFVGGLVGTLFGIGAGNFIGSILMATIGSIIVIAILRAFSSRAPIAR